jgi:hypothetical protein
MDSQIDRQNVERTKAARLGVSSALGATLQKIAGLRKFFAVRKNPLQSKYVCRDNGLYGKFSINNCISIERFNRGVMSRACNMSRSCKTCQHIKRPEIDRRLAAGEPLALVAHDYGLNGSSLHRHRTNCLKLASSNAIKKEAAQGTAAAALLPSKETLGGAYLDLCNRIDQIVAQAQQEGSLSTAIHGLNSIRHTLDSLARLAGGRHGDQRRGADECPPRPRARRQSPDRALRPRA